MNAMNSEVMAKWIRIQRDLERLCTFQVHVGFPNEGDVGNISPLQGVKVTDDMVASDIPEIATRALTQEFGLDKTPKRSFMRPAMDNNEQQLMSIARGGTAGIIAGTGSPERLTEVLSDIHTIHMKQALVHGDHEKNAPFTLAKKAPEDRPLFHTQQMLNSIQGAVVRV